MESIQDYNTNKVKSKGTSNMKEESTLMEKDLFATKIIHTQTQRTEEPSKKLEDSNADCTTREQLERLTADAAFQRAIKCSGHYINFGSDSEPTLRLLIGKYAEAKESRYKKSAENGNITKLYINFKVPAFTLVLRSNVMWAAKISVFCNKYIIKHCWNGDSLLDILNYLNIQTWNKDVTVY
ncbi:uncharacterized protein LOC113271499 isoform X1 [Papaver somniferum]|uniref:uncharacterized protein LOC113271499 isoform X1 n=1 Tax=Papaver somniferum TaxID=3469 RepID=UPI000E6F7FED|nr:uncharacterized protein LOC113271499 isoform X1 [Papaver somniferum]